MLYKKMIFYVIKKITSNDLRALQVMFSSKMQPCFQITQTRRCLVRNRWHEVAISIMLSWSRKKIRC